MIDALAVDVPSHIVCPTVAPIGMIPATAFHFTLPRRRENPPHSNPSARRVLRFRSFALFAVVIQNRTTKPKP
jgi:hypothetical protein